MDICNGCAIDISTKSYFSKAMLHSQTITRRMRTVK